MTIKDFIVSRLQLFCFLVTLILFAEYIIGALFIPDVQLQNSDLLGPIILAGLCIVPTFVTYYRKEPSSGELMIRRIVQLILIEAVVQLAATPGEDTDALQFRLMTGGITLVIYILAMAASWLRSCRESKKLTIMLKEFQQSA